MSQQKNYPRSTLKTADTQQQGPWHGVLVSLSVTFIDKLTLESFLHINLKNRINANNYYNTAEYTVMHFVIKTVFPILKSLRKSNSDTTKFV